MKLTITRSLAVALVLSVVLMLSVSFYWPIQEAYHPLNEYWNGCSKVASMSNNTTLVTSYGGAFANKLFLLAVIGPSIEFSQAESKGIRSFVEAGGALLLADDFGTGNSLLRELNVSARFSGHPIADLYYYGKDHTFPLVSDFATNPLTANLTTVILNRPSYIEIRNSTEVTTLASSSPFSFVDLTAEHFPLENETIDSYPVIASVNIGNGTLVLVSDPSMFINDMVGLYDNMPFFQNLLKMGNGSLAFDVAHLARASLTDWRTFLRYEIQSLRDLILSSPQSIYIQSFLVALALALTFSFELFRLMKRRRRSK